MFLPGEEIMDEMTRRTFMIKGSTSAGALVGGLTIGGGLLSPPRALGGKIEFVETRCTPEKKSLNKKILVAYASFCGSTGSVAEMVGRGLCACGAQVDIRLMKSLSELSSYDAVVLGSSVRSASWLPEALEFVEKNQGHLARVPVAYFLTCLALVKDSEESRRLARSYFEPALKAAPAVQPVDLGGFAGVLNYSKMNFMYRMIMQSKMKDKGVPEGDYRDWNAIRAWAEGLGLRLRIS
jgi:menaquinone-dependent protoporphyrinogen oxidase